MADNYSSEIKAAVSSKKDIQDVAAAWLDVNDIQRKITKNYEEQNDALNKMLNVTKSVKMGVMDRVSREINLKKGLKNLEKEIYALQEKARTMTDDALRSEAKVSLEGMLQRKLAWEKEAELLGKINRSGLGVFLFFLSNAVDLFKTMDKSASNFRKTMGMTRDASKDLREMSEKIAVDFMNVGVNIDGAYNSLLTLGKEMGSVHAVSAELVKTTSILKAQLGVAEEASTGFLRNMAAIAGSSMEAQKDMAYMAGHLSNAAGVPLAAVMKDIASRSNTTLTMMSRIPSQVIRAAVELRKMGTDLERASKSSREILNFTDNINAEMEASVLLGHSINLQKSRELAYHRDIAGSTKEILKLAKENNFAHGMDVFQQEAFARATGKSVDELLNMVQAEEQWNKAKNSQDPKMRARVGNYEKMKAANDAVLNDQGRQLEMMVLQKSNQERLTAISQKWQQIVAQVSYTFLPLIDNVLKFVEFLMPALPQLMAISSFVGKIDLSFISLTDKVLVFGAKLESMGGIFAKIGSFVVGIGSKFSSIFGIISKFAGPMLKFISPILKILGPIGWIITAFQAIKGAIDGWTSSTGTFADKFKGAVLGALRGIIPGFDWIVEKLKWVKDWLFNKLGLAGHSPSAFGLAVVKGIISVQTMIFDALTYPFRHAMAWIFDKIPGLGKFSDKLRGGAGGLIGKSVENETKAVANRDGTITTTPAKVPGAKDKEPDQEIAKAAAAQAESDTKTLQGILNAIKTLNDNLMSGKIGIYIDGQLMSATLARQTEFRGGYGTNRI